MKTNKKLNKKILIVVGIVLVIGLVFVFSFDNKNETKTLLCNRVQSDDKAKLITDLLIRQIDKEIYITYTGELNFLVNNETSQKILSIYIKNQVSKLKEVDEEFATFDESENKITYEFDFDMSSVDESKVKELIGIYSQDIEELKKHFESGGFACEEN